MHGREPINAASDIERVRMEQPLLALGRRRSDLADDIDDIVDSAWLSLAWALREAEADQPADSTEDPM